jgi:hypothetical protein
MPVRLLRALAVAAVISGVACAPKPPDVTGLPDVVDFNFDVRPILSDRCFKCHGPDDRVRKAGLRLDTRNGPFTKLASGHTPVVPGSTRRSELVRRILSTDPAVMMPAPESHLTLSDTERAVLVRWIEQGAVWKPQWSLIPPVKASPPRVTDARPGHNEIDAFVVSALDRHGLKPAPEADRETLIRRVTFDLTGLPPTLDEIDAFVRDTSPDVYARVVDRLFASPAYGERMAVDWLDLARYADSHGYQDDGMRDMSPWRDWVIGAFNRNMPFDQFVTWQLAGDLLPDPTDEQRLATAFNRHHMQSQEGGIVPEEYRTEYVVDRVNTFGRAFLGISVECARCHDHKYDPVTQKEFYQLFSFFNSVNETGQIPYSGMPSPTLVVKDDATRARLESLATAIRPLAEAANVNESRYDVAFAVWLKRMTAPPAPARIAVPGLVAHLPLEGTVRAMIPEGKGKDRKPVRQLLFANTAGIAASLQGDKDRIPDVVEGRVGNARRLVGDSDIELRVPDVTEKTPPDKRLGAFERNEPFSYAIWFRLEKDTSGPLVTHCGGLFDGNRGWELILHKGGTLAAALNHVFPDNSIEIETTAPLAPGAWHHVAVTYDGSSRAAGLRLFLDGSAAATRITIDHLDRSILHAGDSKNWTGPHVLKIGRRHDETLSDVSVDEFRLYDRELTALEVASEAGVADPLTDALRNAAAPASRAALREQFVRRHVPGWTSVHAALTKLRGEENALLTARPEVMVMRELPKPRPTFVLARGAYDAPTTPVQPGTPRAILPLADRLPKTRLGLARWLFDPKHPLTARVVANRAWAMFFGAGIVATPEDFGSQGELPTHPELLDWLATTLVESKWDLKALERRIVLSATYRQSSVASARLREDDPANRWLARGPSYRRPVEQIRDNALAVSGLLVSTIGGKSVYPYQPRGLWEELATRNATTYTPGHGDDLHRRTLYSVWKRSTPPPAAISFDSPERLFCVARRQRTSTPLQALVLLNDPQYLEAARVLGDRMATSGGGSTGERVAFGYRLATGRTPSTEQRTVLTRLYEEERASFGSRPAAARKLLAVGEHPRDRKVPLADAAAYTIVANTLLSLDAAVTKR